MTRAPDTTPRSHPTDPTDLSGPIDLAALVRAASGEAPASRRDGAVRAASGEAPASRYDEAVLAVGAPPLCAALLAPSGELTRRARPPRRGALLSLVAASAAIFLGASAAAQWLHRAPAASPVVMVAAARAEKPATAASPVAPPERERLPALAERVPVAIPTASVVPPVATRAAVRPPAVTAVAPPRTAAPAAPTPSAADTSPVVEGFGVLAAREVGSAASAVETASLPALPSRTELSRVLRGLQPAVARCGDGEGAVVMAELVLEGATGRVATARVDGAPELGTCIASALEEARLAPFAQSRFTVTFPFRI